MNLRKAPTPIFTNIPTRQGKAPVQVFEETVKRMLERRTTFLEGAQLGKGASRRGDTVSHEDIVARVDRLVGDVVEILTGSSLSWPTHSNVLALLRTRLRCGVIPFDILPCNP